MIAQTIIMAGAAIGVLYGGGSWIEHYYAHAEDVTLINERLEQKIEGDYYDRLTQRIWKLEDRYGEQAKHAPESVREEYRRLLMEKQQLDQRPSAYDPQGMRQNRAPRMQEKY